jgi:AcrR family transcriptional regulator
MARNTRDRIVAAASDLFVRNGVRASGVNAIIAASGVAKATFYRHFSSKDEVVAAWLRSLADPQIEWLATRIQRSATEPSEQLGAYFDALVARTGQPGFSGFAFLDVVLGLGPEPSELHTLVDHYLEQTRNELARFAAAAGACDTARASELLQLLALGLIVRVRAEPHFLLEAGQAAREGADRLVREG